MAIAISSVQVIYGNDNGTDTFYTGITAPSASDQVIALIVRGNGPATGSIGSPNLDDGDYNIRYHHDPSGTSRGIADVWTKDSALGTETTLAADWSTTTTPDPESGQMLVLYYLTGADLSGLTFSSTNYSQTSGTTAVAADSLDETLHIILENGNSNLTTGELPTSDTQKTVAGGSPWRSAGASVSGGGTTYSLSYAVDVTRQGCTVNINIPAASLTPVTTVQNFAEAAEVRPDTDMSSGIDVNITSLTTITAVEYQVVRNSDGYFWNAGTSAWQVGTSADSDAVSEASPYLHTFLTGPGEADLTEGSLYTIKTRATNSSGQSAYVDRTLTIGTWTYATDTTVTAAATSTGAPAETIAATGTAYDTTITASGNALPETITASGTAYDATFTTTGDAPAGTSTASGTAFDATITISPTSPTVSITSPTAGQVFAETTTEVAFAGTHADTDGTVADIQYRTQLNSDPFTAWATTSTATSPWAQTVSGLSAGDALTFQVRSLDNDGLYSTTAAVTVYVAATKASATETLDPLSDTFATRPATDYYRVLFADAKTGTVHGELPVIGFRWNVVLNGAGGISVDIPIEVDDPSPAFNASNLRAGSTLLWVVRAGVIMFGGIVTGKPSIDLAANKATLSGVGFHGYLRHRHIRSDLDFVSIDQLTIAETLVALAAPAIGVEINAKTSGRARTRTYRGYELKPIGEAVEQLAATINGFDFGYTYDFVGNQPTATFETRYPATGTQTVLRFDIGSNCGVASIEEDGTQLGNVAITSGSSDAGATPISVVTDPASLSDTPMFENVQSYPQISRQVTLEEHGRNRLNKIRQPINRLSLVVYQDTGPQLGSFRPGDRVTVTGAYGWWNVSGTFRITAYAVTVVDGGEQVTVDVAPLAVFA